MSTPKTMVRAIGNEIAALPQVKELLKKYGLTTVDYAGGVINGESFTVKIKFGHEVEEGDLRGPSKFAQHGLPEDIIGKPIKLSGRSFTIVDVKPQNAQGSLKKCVVIEGAGGGRYITTAADVKRALGLTSAPVGGLIQVPVPGTAPIVGELAEKFKALANRLSPENLSCDGELNRNEVAKRHAQIMREWSALEKLAGRKVFESEFPY